MYHPTSRVLAVLELLQSQRRMTGAELAQRLDVNIRTLRRYITMLQDIGIPIIAERGRHGAYELDAGFRLPPMIFTDEEALVLEIGLLAVSQLGLKEKHHAIESARSKLERVMPIDIQSYANTLSKTIQLELDTVSSHTASHILLAISHACENRLRLELHYRSSNGDENEREVDPYGIACLRGLWYVVGWCHLRQSMRSFRIDRILNITLSDQHFTRSDNFDALSHIEQAIATLPRQYTFKIALKTDLIRAQASFSTVFAVLEAQDNHILLQGTVDDLPWLARQLASLPFEFVILEPVELRSSLQDHAKNLLNSII